MLSGQGRHRRPRQAPALIVAAGVTGSAIAIPLLAATSASAASTDTWDKLAQCESGGAWSANPGNGYYGGLQLSQDTWESHGGLDYAPSADQASKSQQISVAEKVLGDRGTAAWPSCAPIAGLTDGGAAADVDPGAPVTGEPSDPSAPSDPSGSTGDDEPEGSKDSKGSKDSGSADDSGDSKGAEKGEPSADPSNSADPSADPSDDPSADPEKPSGDPGDARDKNHDESGEKGDKGHKGGAGDADGASGSGKSGEKDGTSPDAEDATAPSEGSGSSAGRHRGDRADEDESAGGRPGRHASRGEERTGAVADGTYTVRSGDSLSVIADDLDVEGGWHELYTENKKTVGDDPDLILPGQSLDLGEK
ncbi:transglycosylase family protein [Streptomyces sp. NPDC058308]|uniref:transglycosylase family protein n=1 Tax=Streptomyces sp. NPDC058308 TaxID=3346440 RepID=UPI0036E51EAC